MYVIMIHTALRDTFLTLILEHQSDKFFFVSSILEINF